MRALAYHALSNLFPLIEGAEFDDLVADVSGHGVLPEFIAVEFERVMQVVFPGSESQGAQ